MSERRFVPFNPQEPRPTPIPKVEAGVLVAAFDENAARVTDWAPLDANLTVTWGPNLTCTAVSVVLWDGGDRHTSMPLPGPYVVAGGQMTVVMPGSPEHRMPGWNQWR